MENISKTHTTGYLVSSEGYIIEPVTVVLKDFNEDDAPENLIMTSPPIDGSLWTPMWNGAEWVEGETGEERAERESQQLLESLKPSPQEVVDAELEIKLLTMLTELEVIQ